MLGYIARRLKTSYNVFNLRSLHCRPSDKCQNLNHNEDKINHSEFYGSKEFGRCDWRSSNKASNLPLVVGCSKNEKRRFYNASNIYFQWNVLKWTTGFLCSFYASQVLCFYARHRRNNEEWKRIEQALADRQKIQKKFHAKSYGISAYQKSHVPSHNQSNFSFSDFGFSHKAVPITNDYKAQPQDKTSIDTETANELYDTQPQNSLYSAADNLKSTMGHVEFTLGIQSLKRRRPEVAVSHFQMASLHKHPEATFNLGVCYEKGIGIGMNLKNAMECYRAAANLGHKNGMYNLGVYYARGIGGLKKNRDAARECFKTASQMGSIEAKEALGMRTRKAKQPILCLKSHQITSQLSPMYQVAESIIV